MEINKIIKTGDTFNLVPTLSDSNCGVCAFCNKEQCQCSLITHDTTMNSEEEDEMYNICQAILHKHWEKVDNKEENMSHISSTGVVNPSPDAAPKEPSNDAPRVTKANTKRALTLELTLRKARDWYDSHNTILEDLALKAFTPAELKDVRRCTMNVDIKTAKRLYRNAENAVRDFVLSAFSEEELKD